MSAHQRRTIHIAVIGAGAVGCFLAARLQGAGYRISLVGRAEQVSAIRERGLLVRDDAGHDTRVRLPVDLALSARPDLVLLAVKLPDLAAACRGLLPLAEGVPVVALQNGLAPERVVAEVLGRQAVLGGTLMAAVTYLVPGEITVHVAGWLVIGEAFRPAGRRLAWIARVLDAALPTVTTGDLVAARWSKVVFNLNNGLCAASGLTLPEIGADPVGRRVSLGLMREGVQVARAAGGRLSPLAHARPLALARHPLVAALMLLQGTAQTAPAALPEAAGLWWLTLLARSPLNRIAMRGSTWQSLARGRPTEIEALNGAIARRGRELGIATPYNDQVVEAVRAVERTHTAWPLPALLPGSRRSAAIGAGGSHDG